MSERQLKAGTKMFFGVPANPIPEVIADAIGQVVAQVPGILEAYIPQCYIEGDSEARQVLVVGIRTSESITEVMPALTEKMKLLLPPGAFMDIIPYPSSSLPQEARVEKCRVFGAPKRPWWKVW